MAACIENHSSEINLKMADTSLTEELAAAETSLTEELAAAETSLAEELATAEEHATAEELATAEEHHVSAEDNQGFRCFTKALELPMVSVLTNSVTATTELISNTR